MSKEIEYPVYKGGNWHFYKIVSENEAIEVYYGYDDFRIQTYPVNGISEDEITEAEFLEKYYSVRRKLDQICLIQIDK